MNAKHKPIDRNQQACNDPTTASLGRAENVLTSKKFLCFLTICTLGTACSTGPQAPNKVQDVHFLSEDPTRTIDKYDIVEFRAQHLDQTGETPRAIEVLGVTCDLIGEGFTLQIVPPAKVNVPMYLGTLQPITANCASDGQFAQATFEPRNITTNPRPNPLKGGLIGIAAIQLAAAANKAGRDQTQDHFDFPNVLKVNFDHP